MIILEYCLFQDLISNGRAGAISNEGNNDLVIKHSTFSFVECQYPDRCGGSIYKEEGSLSCIHVCFDHSEGRSGNNQGGSAAMCQNSLLVLGLISCCFSSSKDISMAADSPFFSAQQKELSIDHSNASCNSGNTVFGNCLVETSVGNSTLLIALEGDFLT